MWRGPELRFKNPDGTWGEYTFLRGHPGDEGPRGIEGEKGDRLNHEWRGPELRFENPDGSWGEYTFLKGPPGDAMADVAAAGFNTVGTYTIASLKSGTSYVLAGETISGSNLTPETATGTWRNMGGVAYAQSYELEGDPLVRPDNTSIFLRIS